MHILWIIKKNSYKVNMLEVFDNDKIVMLKL